MTEDVNLSGDATQHLDEMTCLLYIERQLDRTRAQEISAHTQDCVACRTLLRALERESRLLTRAMLEEEEALPARLAQFQERVRKSMQWIWTLAFGLAATGVYALYTEYIEPWQQQLETAGFGGSNLLSLLIFQGAFWKGWQSMVTLLEVLAMLTIGSEYCPAAVATKIPAGSRNKAAKAWRRMFPVPLAYTRLATVRPAISSTRKMTRKMKNRVLAMAMEVPAMPVKPSRPAIKPITRKTTAHLSIRRSTFPNIAESQHRIGPRSSGAFLRQS